MYAECASSGGGGGGRLALGGWCGGGNTGEYDACGGLGGGDTRPLLPCRFMDAKDESRDGGERGSGGGKRGFSAGVGDGFGTASLCWRSACPTSLSHSDRRSAMKDLTLRASVALKSVS